MKEISQGRKAIIWRDWLACYEFPLRRILVKGLYCINVKPVGQKDNQSQIHMLHHVRLKMN